MDARTLSDDMGFLGQERAARKLLIDEKLAKAESVALMTRVEVCEELLKTYVVVGCDDETIVIVKKNDLEKYKAIVKLLSR